MRKRVLVTGITGYIGQHIAAELLTKGYEVVGTLRSLQKAEKTMAALANLPGAKGVSYIEADLLSDTNWASALEGCDYLVHVASPFFLKEPSNEKQLITPAVEGTQRVLSAAIKAKVKRVVLTSSIAAMTSGKPTGTYGPDSWSDLNINIGAYAKSKTLAEQAAWEIIKNSSIELVVINPGFVLGPSLGAPGEGTSETMITNMIHGKMPAIPDLAMGMVDVRDIASLHVKALETPNLTGKRFIAASAEPISISYLAEVLKKLGHKKAPTIKLPNFTIKILALFNPRAKAMLGNLGVKIAYNIDDTLKLLTWNPTPIEKTLKDMTEKLNA